LQPKAENFKNEMSKRYLIYDAMAQHYSKSNFKFEKNILF